MRYNSYTILQRSLPKEGFGRGTKEYFIWISRSVHSLTFFNRSPGRNTRILNRSAAPAKIIDSPPASRDNSTIVGAALRHVRSGRTSKLPQSVFSPLLGAKSLFCNILQVNPVEPKIWREFPPKSMIPKDRYIKKNSVTN